MAVVGSLLFAAFHGRRREKARIHTGRVRYLQLDAALRAVR